MNSPKIESLEFKNEEKKQMFSKISELPEFADVCCFMNHFGEKLGVILTFPRIAHLLSCETDADLQVLTTLLVKLLNKMRLRTQLNRWQPALGRFLQRHAYNCDELRSIGDALNNGGPPTLFFSLPPEKRLRVLLFCLETQFQLNVPFKEKVKSMDTQMLRTPPLGTDIFGNSYWLLVDNECHFLLYRSEPVEMTLELLGDTFTALETIIADLKDDKYEKTPISELYAVFQGSLAKTESPEAFNISSPQHTFLPLPPFPEECKVIEAIASPTKEDVMEQMEEKSIDVDGKVIISENTDIESERRDVPGGEQPPEKTASERVATEEAEPQEITGRHELTRDNTRIDSQIETLGLRRSSRKRKQVEFLSMESFYAPKTRSKKPMLLNPIPKIEKKLKKEKSHKEKSTKKCSKSKKSKKYRNGHNGNGGCLWTHSPEDSESDKDEDEDLWAEDGSNFGDNADSSLPENEKQLPHDWLEDIESDFDEGGDDNSDVVAGRNLQRQKAQVLDEAPCQICTISNHPEWLLLCDSCDLGYHAQCLRPALHYIPPGDWFCPRCLHSRLVSALSDQLTNLQIKSKKLDSAARMQERLNFVNISVSNILRDERTRFSAAADSENSTSYSSSSSESEELSRRPGQKRPRYHGSEVSSSDGSMSGSKEDSETSDEDDIQEEEEKLSVRSTRHRKIHYDINAAFQQLDEVLVEDEKYAQEKMERSKAKSVHIEEGVETKEETDLPGRLPMPPSSVISKTARKKRLSSSSLDASGSEELGRKKRRKRLSSGSEEFRPSDESISDEDDSELGEVEEESDENASESSASSDQSWKVGRNRRRQGKRRGRGSKRRSKHRRSGRTGSRRRRDRQIPRFEGPSTDEDDDGIPVRRSARIRVNYREIDTSEEEEDEELKKKSFSGRGKRISSGSEYAPSQEEEAEVAVACKKEEVDEDDRNKKNEEVENRVPVQPIQKIVDFSTSGARNISQALTTDFPITAELELDENELQIDEDLMSVKEDDPIFQNFLIDDINLPINQDPNDDVDGI